MPITQHRVGESLDLSLFTIVEKLGRDGTSVPGSDPERQARPRTRGSPGFPFPGWFRGTGRPQRGLAGPDPHVRN